MDIQNIKLDKIRVNKDNPRTITRDKFDKLVNSILVFPKMLEIRPIVVDGNMTALGGNQRTEALKRIAKMTSEKIHETLSGITDYQRMTKEEQNSLVQFWKDWMKSKEVPVINADNLTEDEKKQFIIKDNNSFGEWDFAELSEKWDTNILDDWGVDLPDDWCSPEEEKKEVEEDDFSEKDASNAETRVKSGDIWQLGEHRLMCGDSTKMEDVERLMNGEKADLYLTDPPYNVAYEGGTKDALKILNDSMDDESFRLFLMDAFTVADSVLKKGASFYIWHADSEGFNFRYAVKHCSWLLKQCLIWNKNSMVMGRQDYQWKHEPCLYGWKDGASHKFSSDRKQTTVLEFNRPNRNAEHPTMKPVGLFGYLIGNSSKKGDIVLDSFCGSGTTIIACEQLGRKARCMELSEHYASVIIERYIKFKGSAEDVFRLNLDGTKTYYNELYHGM